MPDYAHKIVLCRHGQSTWNLENRFTGWTDVPLTDLGRAEAEEAGKLIRAHGFTFDVAHTSLLKRAVHTLWAIMAANDREWVPVTRAWELNERHYGALQGLNKAETAERHGDEQVLEWRRSYDVPPPALSDDDDRRPHCDPRYAGIPANVLPLTECLKDTVERVVPYWKDTIVPDIKAGKDVLVAAHGNSLRALVKYLDGIGDEEIVGLNIPTGVPLVYELDADLKPIKHYYLGDQAEIEAKAKAVAAQAKAQ